MVLLFLVFFYYVFKVILTILKKQQPCFILRDKLKIKPPPLILQTEYKKEQEVLPVAVVCRVSSSWSEIPQTPWYLYRHFPVHTRVSTCSFMTLNSLTKERYDVCGITASFQYIQIPAAATLAVVQQFTYWICDIAYYFNCSVTQLVLAN